MTRPQNGIDLPSDSAQFFNVELAEYRAYQRWGYLAVPVAAEEPVVLPDSPYGPNKIDPAAHA